MDTNHTDFQLYDNYYLKINFSDSNISYTVFKGKFYVCFSSIHNLGKILSSLNKKTIFSLCTLNRKAIEPTLGNMIIEKKEDTFFENFRIFRHIRLYNLLKKYGFSDNEIISLFEEFNMEHGIYADNIIHVRIKAAILIDILFKKSNLVLFHTSGLTYPSSKIVYKRIYKRLQEYPEKSAIIFEHGEKIKRTVFKEISVDDINGYEEWIVESIRKYSDISGIL